MGHLRPLLVGDPVPWGADTPLCAPVVTWVPDLGLQGRTPVLHPFACAWVCEGGCETKRRGGLGREAGVPQAQGLLKPRPALPHPVVLHPCELLHGDTPSRLTLQHPVPGVLPVSFPLGCAARMLGHTLHLAGLAKGAACPPGRGLGSTWGRPCWCPVLIGPLWPPTRRPYGGPAWTLEGPMVLRAWPQGRRRPQPSPWLKHEQPWREWCWRPRGQSCKRGVLLLFFCFKQDFIF